MDVTNNIQGARVGSALLTTMLLTAPGLVDAATLPISPGSPMELIKSLGRELGRIAQTTGSWKEQQLAEQKTALEMRKLIATEPAHKSLVERDGDMSPLMYAAMSGYADVVEALLTSQLVRQDIDAQDSVGASAWALTQYSWATAAWSCNPGFLSSADPFQWVPRLMGTTYYFLAPENPFQRTRQALARAGAKQDLGQAKKAWLARCPVSDSDLQARVRVSDDILMTLTQDGRRRLMQFEMDLKTQAMRNVPPGQSSIQQTPQPLASSTPFVTVTPAPPPRPVPTPRPVISPPLPTPGHVAAQSVCQVMPEVVKPPTWYDGEAVLHAMAEVVDGRIADVKVNIRSWSDLSPSKLPDLRLAVMAAVRRYECAGSHSIERVFEFKGSR